MKSRGHRILLIGTGSMAQQLLANSKVLSHNEIVGCLRISEQHDVLVQADLCVGMYTDLKQMVDCLLPSLIMVADNTLPLSEVLSLLSKPCLSRQHIVQLMSSTDASFAGITPILWNDLPLCRITQHPMPLWTRVIKRLGDVIISAIALFVLSPCLILLCFYIGRHPIYRQERIGKRGKRFTIYKLRTMCLDAEKRGPQLSSQDDVRITPIGRILRKYRIDEFAQFYNVLKGDMSLIGPRPERWYYFKQVAAANPNVYSLLNIRPGITSLGMVRYGYASTVDMMLERVEMEQKYYKNMSLWLDLAIVGETIKTIVKGRGV